jgi:hypothetical protein
MVTAQQYPVQYNQQQNPYAGQYGYEQPEYDEVQQQQYLDQQTEDQAEQEFLGYSEEKKHESVWVLINKGLQLPNTTRIGNVDKHELGDLGMNIREAQRVALIGDTFGHPIFSKFFFEHSNITTGTSMAKKGWFMELGISSKRFSERSMAGGNTGVPGAGQTKQPGKWDRLFGKTQMQQPQS